MPSFPKLIDIDTIDGRNGFVIQPRIDGQTGTNRGDDLGSNLTFVGDVNGDGYNDLLIAAPLGETDGLNGATDTGEVYLIFGPAAGLPAKFDLTTINGTNGVRFSTDAAGAYLGNAFNLTTGVSAAGDMNGDGLADFVIASMNKDYATVVFGKTSWTANVSIDSIGGQNGFKFYHFPDGGSPQIGRNVASVGDVNNDGFADIAVGDSLFTTYVIYGKSNAAFQQQFAANGSIGLSGNVMVDSQFDGTDGFAVNPALGYRITAISPQGGSPNELITDRIGDFNGDGIADFMVSAPYPTNGAPNGRAWVVFGATSTGSIQLTASGVVGAQGFAILSPTATQFQFGLSLSGAGDLNSDGRPDLVIADGTAGKAYVVFGNATMGSSPLDLTTLNGSNGFVVTGLAAGSGGAASVIVASAGDINGDGRADLAIGLPSTNAAGVQSLTGQVYIVYGKAVGFAASLNIASLTRDQGFRVDGVGGFGAIGGSLSAGDMNGDGVSDLAIGNGVRVNGSSQYFGGAYVLYGRRDPTGPVTLTGDAARNGLWGGEFADSLNGGGGLDVLTGFGGNDRLDGGTGADRMEGGLGDDIYIVDNVGDVVVEAAGEGSEDRVFTSVSVDLASADIEKITTDAEAGTAAIDIAGSNAANFVIGNAGANTLIGRGGNDTLLGGGGADLLIGGAGADQMYGGAGDDIYYIDETGDQVFESVGEGYDRAFASVSVDLGGADEVEQIATETPSATTAIDLAGGNSANLIQGNAGANTLIGRGGNDVLVGNGGADVLIGGTGADQMYGGTGDDIFYIDNIGDQVFESVGEGFDRAFASVSVDLGGADEIDVIATDDNAGTAAIDLAGGNSANRIQGNDGANTLVGRGGGDTLVGAGGNDVLIGGTGADTMDGGLGNDQFYVDNALDQIVEAAGQGIDTVFTSVSYVLTAAAEVERLQTDNAAGTGAIDLTGNAFANVITGNAGVNTIDGKGGADTLNGGAGADTFAFTSTLGGGNIDLIQGFVVGTDRIALASAIFGGMPPGTLSASAFRSGATATAAADRILYDAATGRLFYDADGNGAGAAVQFATVDPGLAVTEASFVVI